MKFFNNDTKQANLFEFIKNPVLFLRKIKETGSDVQRIKIGPKYFVFVFNPDIANEILVKKANIYPQNRFIYDRIKPITGKKGLVQLEGQESVSARLKTRPMFDSNAFHRAKMIIESCTENMLEKIESSSVFDVTHEMTSLILKTAFRIFLDFESEELISKIGKKFLRLNEICGYRMRSLFSLPLFVPTPRNIEIKFLEKQIRALLSEHILKAKSKESKAVSNIFYDDEHALDHCLTFLFAGHETTAASLAFTLLLLSKHQKYQDQIADGNDDVTLAVYKESLRLFPPAYMLVRQAKQKDELLGQIVEKDDQIIIAVESMQRSSQFFKNSDEFYPERFFEKQQNPFAFIPFGAGSKSCIGQRLAYFEACLVLKKVCKQFRLFSDIQSIQAEPLITLHPKANQLIQIQLRK